MQIEITCRKIWSKEWDETSGLLVPNIWFRLKRNGRLYWLQNMKPNIVLKATLLTQQWQRREGWKHFSWNTHLTLPLCIYVQDKVSFKGIFLALVTAVVFAAIWLATTRLRSVLLQWYTAYSPYYVGWYPAAIDGNTFLWNRHLTLPLCIYVQN